MNYSNSIPMPVGMFMLGAVDPLPASSPKLDYNHPPKNFKPKNNKPVKRSRK